jgi:glutathione S-transferase
MTSPSFPVLYSFRRCPYAIRARMALRYAGVPVEMVEVALRQKPAALLAASPKGTVPVLVTPDGAVIDQSLDIMQWALRQSDPDGWLGAGSAAEADAAHAAHAAHSAHDWIALNDEIFKPLLDRYKYATRHPELTPAEHRSRALEAMIRLMEAQLQQTRWLLGPQISIADVALFPFVRQFAGVDRAWFDAQPLPALQAWLATWLDSRLFHWAMDKAAATASKT